MTLLDSYYWIGSLLGTVKEEHEKIAPLRKEISGGEIDWEKIVKAGSSHLVLPAVYSKFKQLVLTGILPEDIREHLKYYYDLNFRRNQHIKDEIHDITVQLNSEKIAPILLKGSANLFDKVYPYLGTRIIGDIDFLVSDEVFAKTVCLIKRMGYSGIVKGCPSYYPTMKHFPRMFKPDTVAGVEIHRLPVAAKYSRNFNFKIINEAKKPLPGTLEYYTLCDAHKVIINFIHGQLNDRGNRYALVSLRNLYDLHLLSGRVDICQTLKNFGSYKKHAANYLQLYAKTFNRKVEGLPTPSFRAKLFLMRFNANYSSKGFYFINYIFITIFNRVSGYILTVKEAIFNPVLRNILFRKLVTPEWYFQHFKTLRNIFPK